MFQSHHLIQIIVLEAIPSRISQVSPVVIRNAVFSDMLAAQGVSVMVIHLSSSIPVPAHSALCQRALRQARNDTQMKLFPASSDILLSKAGLLESQALWVELCNCENPSSSESDICV